ncbi:tRNA (adenosine(37)-N6)-threonylcarbamoyltransferase complex dimerization subunit type 1 TsaB [Corynebacterium atypicum]|uniref:tRNA (adenosine(37)-N6)-threonylcarbamoyltransferase complex dimerization subunit type 1 TsaB n=1 Tax=Corynebacterium atypicum TaxID=191610 RepID=UPI0006897D59|nr:tRNA (adenosine(37)-N6)-threonylcarbamoyltransferase complex dimerization subunit type 1 TsaB [Corynebacterium atypicum]
MITLAIDSSTARLVVGLVRVPDAPEQGGEAARQPAPTASHAHVLAQRVLDDARRHNEALVPAIADVLGRAGLGYADIEAVTCGCGPGPFTGLRVGMATAAATADSLGVPLRGVCSLDAMAVDPAWRGVGNPARVIASDARRREVYWAAYDAAGSRVIGPEVCKPAALPAAELERIGVRAVSAPEGLVLGEWAQPLERLEVWPTAQTLCAAPTVDFRPIYLRRPDAVAPRVRVSEALCQ